MKRKNTFYPLNKDFTGYLSIVVAIGNEIISESHSKLHQMLYVDTRNLNR